MEDYDKRASVTGTPDTTPNERTAQPNTDPSTTVFGNTSLGLNAGTPLDKVSVQTGKASKADDLGKKNLSSEQMKAQDEVVRKILEGNYQAALPLMKKMDEETIKSVLHTTKARAEEKPEKYEKMIEFLTSVQGTFEAVSKVRKEHKLSPHDVVSISFVAQNKLQEVASRTSAPRPGNERENYEEGLNLYKRDTGLPRTIRIVPGEGFSILNKSKVRGMFGIGIRSFIGKGTFKKITSTIEVVKEESNYEATSAAQAAARKDSKEHSRADDLAYEGNRAKLLSHPNIVSVSSAFYYKTKAYGDKASSFIMKQCDTDLKSKKNFSYNDETRCQIFEGLANGLKHLHTFKCPPSEKLKSCGFSVEGENTGLEGGVIHRDIRPENILLNTEDDGKGNIKHIVKIGDFGLAESANNPSALAEIVLRFLPPEVDTGKSTPTKAHDMYQAGCTLYEFEYKTTVPWNKIGSRLIGRSALKQKESLAKKMSKGFEDKDYDYKTITEPKEMRRYIISRLIDPNSTKRMTAEQYEEASKHLRKITDASKKQR